MTLKQRLDACARKGALSTADLATWFELAYATVRSYRAGVEPYDARRSQIEQRLSWLESAIEHDPRLPVPLSVKAIERKEYVTGVLNRVRRNR